MHVAVVDGAAVLAAHIVKCSLSSEYDAKTERLLWGLHRVDGGIACYNQSELEKAKAALKELGISYTVEELKYDSSVTEKIKGVKYTSRSEVVGHLLENKEPESVVNEKIKNEIYKIKTQIEKIAPLK